MEELKLAIDELGRALKEAIMLPFTHPIGTAIATMPIWLYYILMKLV